MNPIMYFTIVIWWTGIFNAFSQSKITLNIDHIAISVKNLEVASAFYKNILGFEEITNRTENAGIKWFSIGDGKELHMISVVKEPVTINKAVHVAFKTDRFDDFILSLKENNIPYSDWSGNTQTVSARPDGIRQVFFQDPDGYWLEVNSINIKN